MVQINESCGGGLKNTTNVERALPILSSEILVAAIVIYDTRLASR